MIDNKFVYEKDKTVSKTYRILNGRLVVTTKIYPRKQRGQSR